MGEQLSFKLENETFITKKEDLFVAPVSGWYTAGTKKEEKEEKEENEKEVLEQLSFEFG